MENNNNGRGLFYGVIGVATLVVTIIGATFAYFSASISSAGDAIQTNAANISLTIEQNVTGIKGGIVPVDESKLDEAFREGNYIGDTASALASEDYNCIDEDGNPFCSVYSFTITNPSTAAQTVYARMDLTKNTFAANTDKTLDGDTVATSCEGYMGFDTSKGLNSSRTEVDVTGNDRDASADAIYCATTSTTNLAFAIFKGNPSDVKAKIGTGKTGWSVLKAVTTLYEAGKSGNTEAANATTAGNTIGTVVTGEKGDLVVSRTALPNHTGNTTLKIELDPLTQTLKSGGSVEYTVIVWLHENWTNQEDDEMKEFQAGITFSTSQGGSGVTAQLTTSG